MRITGFNGGVGSKVTIDGEKVKEKMKLSSQKINMIINTSLPTIYKRDSEGNEDVLPLMCVYENEIHIMGGSKEDTISCSTAHYKLDGDSWVEVSTLPVQTVCHYGARHVVVFGGQIHLLVETTDTDKNQHYTWNGTTWTYKGALPIEAGSAIVWNNELYIAHRNSGFYKWDGSSWINDTSIIYPSLSLQSLIFVINDELYAVSSLGKVVKWTGTEWNAIVDATSLSGNDLKLIGATNDMLYGYIPHEGLYYLNGSEWKKIPNTIFPASVELYSCEDGLYCMTLGKMPDYDFNLYYTESYNQLWKLQIPILYRS